MEEVVNRPVQVQEPLDLDGGLELPHTDLHPINRSVRAEDFPFVLNRGTSSDEAKSELPKSRAELT